VVLIPVCITTAELVDIFGLFATIRFITTDAQDLSIITLIFVLIVFALLKVGLQFASGVTISSERFARTQINGFRFRKEDQLFLKSCKPLAIRIGGTFTVTDETFPTISQYIIMNNVINLLLLFP